MNKRLMKYTAELFLLIDAYLMNYDETAKASSRDFLERLRLDRKLKLVEKRQLTARVNDLILAVECDDKAAAIRLQDYITAMKGRALK